MADMQYTGDMPRFIRDPSRSGYSYGETTRDTYARHARYSPDPDPAAQPGPVAESSEFGRIATWAGALLSLGLVVAMGAWAWQLTVRDVSGVPVIRALEGPVRTVPDDPGGAQAPHQGLAVNRIAEGGEAAAAPDQVVLAPEPLDLDAITPPMPDPTPSDTAAAAPLSTDTQALIDRILDRDTPALAEADTDAAPDTERAEATAQATAEAELAADILPASVPGVARSLRPVLRPAGLERSAISTTGSNADTQIAELSVSSDGVTELSISDLSQGTRLVQLGAFDSAEIARSEWVRLAGRYPDFFAGRARIVQRANSGGQEFFRLRANGFDTLDASRRFCAAMVAQGAACIPVTIR